eukprot:CAMPEP_0170132346 /NCGR_PEP_ID=MMETSP0020_2-20130122/23807_1 /TAXON_ID=98059 /ORGANISM="Dinobryon sp., Strain UTEXLB2267" /LENGTH=403 /DNA_ID=CAMNT_0010367631 /DNA_START=36 /DNA_END=1244 /DNA_ORIENTATION=+
MSKKDRHMKTLQEFSKFLETLNEKVVQEVLKFSRDVRESLESIDEDLAKFLKYLDDSDNLIVKSEEDLLSDLENLKNKLKTRGDIIMKFATDLDDTERLRADLAGKELKSLVDKLVAIAHQLPDDIEHIVESEAFELNSEIITNKKNHANTSGALRISHVQVEADGLQSWENSRLKWRQLRHEKALKDFEAQIHSAEFTDPVERQHFMQQVRGGQSLRRQQLQKLLGQLGQLSAENITSERVHKVSAEFLALQEQEDRAVGSCHAGLEDLGIQHKARVAQRVEALRAELHAYGALQQEPDLAAISRSLSAAVTEALVGDMLRRLQQINAGFPLRGVMQERGRLGQLDKLRALVTKTRTAPRAEVAQVLRALLPELQDLAELPQLADDFRASLAAVAGEIAAEL